MTNKKITKQEFIDRVAKKANISKKDANIAVNAMINVIGDAMGNEENIVIPDFGSFKIQKYKAKKGRNIHTGESITIPAHNKIKFTPGNALKARVEN